MEDPDNIGGPYYALREIFFKLLRSFLITLPAQTSAVAGTSASHSG